MAPNWGKINRRELIGGAAALTVAAGLSGCRFPFSSGKSVIDSLPAYDIPAPTGYLRTNWLKDPFSYCSYSYMAPSPYGADLRRMLAAPVGRRVLITGEATSVSNPATVHGALESGLRTATLIEENRDRGSSVTVIGAGASGLACARQLADSGFEVKVIEGRDRVGGRVRSEELDGVPAELGASWIQGVDGNPLVGLATDAGVETAPFAWDYEFVNPQQRREGLAGELQMNTGLNSFQGSWRAAAVKPLSEVFPRRRTPGLQWAITYEISQEYGADPEQLSILATWEGDYYGGGDVIVSGGYSNVLTAAAGDLDVTTDMKVVAVEHNRTEAVVEVEGGERFTSDVVVVTVPIGVLKKGAIRFDPPLPETNRLAIDGLGAGVLDKLWLQFDEVFWEPDPEVFQWIDPERPGLWAGWVNGNSYLGKPLLMGLNGGSQAAALSGWSDEQVLRSGMEALNSMYREAG